MANEDQSWMRKFIGGDRPDRSPATVRAETRAAARSADQFAQEAVVALQRFERTFDGSSADQRRLAERFGQLWQRTGLDRVDWDGQAADLSDAERTLVAAARLANRVDGRLTVADASRGAATMSRRQVRSAAAMASDLDARFGDKLGQPPNPAVWLEQSLGRLANAQVMKEMVALETTTKPGRKLMQAVDQAVQADQQLEDAGRKVGKAWAKLDQRQESYDKAWKLTIAYSVVSAAFPTLDKPLWASAVKYAPMAAFAVGVGVTGSRRDAAADALGAGQRDAAALRQQLGSALDRMGTNKRGGAPGR